ncbi:hypothetical protein [Roseomonas sp. HF4]|uniref:hypothetical protein n=1 Tax=Roseomonas sp. HF4 TaxID=2562313 RepID=UPI0010C126B8|nr:hypothetical protein [Roseomonas sp. HF4]
MAAHRSCSAEIEQAVASHTWPARGRCVRGVQIVEIPIKVFPGANSRASMRRRSLQPVRTTTVGERPMIFGLPIDPWLVKVAFVVIGFAGVGFGSWVLVRNRF